MQFANLLMPAAHFQSRGLIFYRNQICQMSRADPNFFLVVAELDYGGKVSQKSEENLEKLYRLVDIVQVVPFAIEWARIFGTIKSRLRSLGKPTGEVGVLIAATAMAHEAILGTANKKHFENIEGLKVEIWPIG